MCVSGSVLSAVMGSIQVSHRTSALRGSCILAQGTGTLVFKDLNTKTYLISY